MSGPGSRPPRPQTRLNFTGLQFVLFAGAGLIGLAGLMAAGLAFGLALAGAAALAVLMLAVWFIAANLLGKPGDRPAPPPRR